MQVENQAQPNKIKSQAVSDHDMVNFSPFSSQANLNESGSKCMLS
jgi:hypothetical protein